MTYGRILEDDDDLYDPFEDEDNYAHEEDDDPETACMECDKPGIDACQCCGGPLCGMHSEIGCGFCKDCPTQEWIEEQVYAND